jgi:divalent metal cation (Fe/Co/Zn/Cd) transporter
MPHLLQRVHRNGRRNQILAILSASRRVGRGRSLLSKLIILLSMLGWVISSCLDAIAQHWPEPPVWVLIVLAIASVVATLDLVAEKVEQLRGK